MWRAGLTLLLACGAPELVERTRKEVEHRPGSACSCSSELGAVVVDRECIVNPAVQHTLIERGVNCYPNDDYHCCVWDYWP